MPQETQSTSQNPTSQTQTTTAPTQTSPSSRETGGESIPDYQAAYNALKLERDKLLHLTNHYAGDVDVEAELPYVVDLGEGNYGYRPGSPPQPAAPVATVETEAQTTAEPQPEPEVPVLKQAPQVAPPSATTPAAPAQPQYDSVYDMPLDVFSKHQDELLQNEWNAFVNPKQGIPLQQT